MILEGLLGDPGALRLPETRVLSDGAEAAGQRLEQAVRRRLERLREPQVFHPITPRPALETGYPGAEGAGSLAQTDAERRGARRRVFDRDWRKRLAKKLDLGGLRPDAAKAPVPRGMRTPSPNLKPTDFPGRPAGRPAEAPGGAGANRAGRTGGGDPAAPPPPVSRAVPAGDGTAARARRLRRRPPADEPG